MKHTSFIKKAIVIILIISMFSFNSYAAKAYINYSEACNSKIDQRLQESMSISDEEIPVIILLPVLQL